jgi:hypothetical protein
MGSGPGARWRDGIFCGRPRNSMRALPAQGIRLIAKARSRLSGAPLSGIAAGSASSERGAAGVPVVRRKRSTGNFRRASYAFRPAETRRCAFGIARFDGRGTWIRHTQRKHRRDCRLARSFSGVAQRQRLPGAQIEIRNARFARWRNERVRAQPAVSSGLRSR